MNGLRAIVLAAGKGVRMESELPKVLHPLLGKPLILHVLDNICQAGVTDTTVVVGYRGELVEAALPAGVSTVWQREQLGTGHAVMQAADFISGFDGFVIVACGDAPLVSSESFAGLVDDCTREGASAAVLTMRLENPKGYGRMVKDASGSLQRIVEEKDATDDIRRIDEVNTGTYVFEASLLHEGLKSLGNNNAQGEYYLTDVLGFMVNKGKRVITRVLENPFEGSGINSKAELQTVEEYLLNKKAGERK